MPSFLSRGFKKENIQALVRDIKHKTHSRDTMMDSFHNRCREIYYDYFKHLNTSQIAPV